MSVEVVFTNRPFVHIPLLLGETEIPNDKIAKYLGLHLDSRLRWGTHIKKKVAQLRLKFSNTQWVAQLGFHFN